jgi:elongation factor G
MKRPDSPFLTSSAPVPIDRPFTGQSRDGAEVKRAADEKAPSAAFVWKTIADPFAGRITMFRVVAKR